MSLSTPYAGSATSAAGETGALGSDYFQTDNNGFMDKLGSSFASGLGQVLSGAKTVGTVNGFSI